MKVFRCMQIYDCKRDFNQKLLTLRDTKVDIVQKVRAVVVRERTILFNFGHHFCACRYLRLLMSCALCKLSSPRRSANHSPVSPQSETRSFLRGELSVWTCGLQTISSRSDSCDSPFLAPSLHRRREYTRETLIQFGKEAAARERAEKQAAAGVGEGFGGFGGFGGGGEGNVEEKPPQEQSDGKIEEVSRKEKDLV